VLGTLGNVIGSLLPAGWRWATLCRPCAAVTIIGIPFGLQHSSWPL
jgi:uncharacterized membrane protein YccF (DUF307 family)